MKAVPMKTTVDAIGVMDAMIRRKRKRKEMR
jgi:hypothetical protein